ncbi:MAG: hypothetical protein ABSE59_11115, partial [Opitutaceae bacterium]
MRLPFHLRLVTWLVLLSYLNVLCPVTMLRADTTPPATLEAPNHPLAQRPIPSHIAPQTGTLTWSFSATPTDTDIFRAHILPEPLVPVGKATNAEENISLAQAITKYKQSASDDLTPFTGFLVQYPNSAWAASLHLNLGLRFFAT